MVSSRRVAREWALKILYQIDIGGSSLPEAREAALERLRREFVQRGSRTASGSQAEEMCLEALTASLRDVLPTLRVPLERALSLGIGRLFQEIPYWQEVRMEKSLRHQMPGVLLSPARLLSPLPDSIFLPAASVPPDSLSIQLAALTPEERTRYSQFIAASRAELPRLFDAEFRKTGLAFARETARNRPLGIAPDETQAYLRTRREAFNEEAAARWQKVGQTVQKQTGDWLRTAAFTVKLVDGTYESRQQLDDTIAALSSGWRLERQVAVDRNIMRLAGYEMMFLPGIPASATINEAVELAKKFSTNESGRFVNGVLGALAQRLGEKETPSVAEETLEGDEQDTIVDITDIADMEEPETL